MEIWKVWLLVKTKIQFINGQGISIVRNPNMLKDVCEAKILLTNVH